MIQYRPAWPSCSQHWTRCGKALGSPRTLHAATQSPSGLHLVGAGPPSGSAHAVVDGCPKDTLAPCGRSVAARMSPIANYPGYRSILCVHPNDGTPGHREHRRQRFAGASLRFRWNHRGGCLRSRVVPQVRGGGSGRSGWYGAQASAGPATQVRELPSLARRLLGILCMADRPCGISARSSTVRRRTGRRRGCTIRRSLQLRIACRRRPPALGP